MTIGHRPKRHSWGAAAGDLRSAETIVIEPGGSAVIPTGYEYDLPHPSLILGRSGLAFREDIVPHIGLIDSDFTGEVKVKLFNHGKNTYTVQEGERVAQMLPIQSIAHVYLPVALGATERGDNGFGSSGK